MQNTIYLFNPEHDMALASNSAFYMTPAHIIKMKSDLSLLPIWYLGEGENRNFVLSNELNSHFLVEMKNLFPRLSSTSVVSSLDGDFESIYPWGWNRALKQFIERSQISIDKMPNSENIDMLRELSSRKRGVELLSSFYEYEPIIATIGDDFSQAIAKPLYTIDEIVDFIEKHNDVMFKAPWSGSGRGVRRVVASASESDLGWMQRVIRTQGCIIGEPFYDKVVDFAMEFVCENGEAKFIGYSLFETDNQGAYKCNILDSDSAIECTLSQYVQLCYIYKVKERLLNLLNKLYADRYSGVLGIDMMICKKSDGYWIHPCVEVNLRMNMGIVAHHFYNRYVSNNSKGAYHVEHYFSENEALENDKLMKERFPLIIKNNLIESGYMSLTALDSNTMYQIYVVISPKVVE